MTLTDPSFRYTWLLWATAFMLPWALLFLARPALRRPMLWLWRNTLVGVGIFLALYAAFLLGLKLLWPGYIEAVWNLEALLAWHPAGLPIEELLFGFAFGMYWSSIYEHLTWQQHDTVKRRTVTHHGRVA